MSTSASAVVVRRDAPLLSGAATARVRFVPLTLESSFVCVSAVNASARLVIHLPRPAVVCLTVYDPSASDVLVLSEITSLYVGVGKIKEQRCLRVGGEVVRPGTLLLGSV